MLFTLHDIILETFGRLFRETDNGQSCVHVCACVCACVCVCVCSLQKIL